MNKATKYSLAIICVPIAAYALWLVIATAFPMEGWFQQKSVSISFNLLLVICVIGFLAGIIETKIK